MPDPPECSRDRCIALFIKEPQPGKVKTRLGQVIGHAQATQLYRCFAQDILATVDALGSSSLIFFTPDHSRTMVQDWLGHHRTYQPQHGQCLGERMANAFEHSFGLGYGQVLLLGSDSPDLPIRYLQEAFAALRRHRVVIGPSMDGGYYGLGFTPETFCQDALGDLPWSTPAVFSQTLQILQQQHPVHILPPWTDIDTAEDLKAFYQRHQGMQISCQAGWYTLDYLQAHHKALFVAHDA
jgi:rSAM/selenodomain-associated transferase 1